MKKLNRKGFTLVELLAVIVILAIIVGIVFPQIMNSINNSRISAIHTSAKEIVRWWENSISADALETDESKKQIPSDILSKVTTEWKCMDEITSDTGKNLFEITGLSAADLVTNGSGGNDDALANFPDTNNISSTTCSAIRYNSAGGVDVLLVAKSGGKYYISGKITYGYSNDANGVTK